MASRRQLNPAFAQQQTDSPGEMCVGGANDVNLYLTARASGVLAAQNRGLQHVPVEMLTSEAPVEPGENWWERVDITKLDCSHNQISQIAASIVQLEKLMTLKLSHNTLCVLPAELFDLVHLAHLDISHNQLLAVSEAISGLSNLREWNVSHNQLVELPCCELPASLVQLNVGHNQLTTLSSASLSSLRSLRSLSARSNQLGTVSPDALCQMHQLEQLDLATNKLQQLPAIDHLAELQSIDVSGNSLSLLPRMPVASKLLALHASHNSIQAIDQSELQHCPLLLELNLASNQLLELPAAVYMHTALKTLDVSQNQLAELPIALGYLGSLSRLLVEGNPVVRTLGGTTGSGPLKQLLRERGAPPTALHTPLTAEYWREHPPGSVAEWRALQVAMCV